MARSAYTHLAPDAVLLQQVALQLVSKEIIDSVFANPGSRLAQMWVSATEFGLKCFQIRSGE